MSSDFSITEFRRRRASDNPPPPETGQLPFDMPTPNQHGLQEFVPEAAPAPIPEAVPNPYAAQAYEPMVQAPQHAMNPVSVPHPATQYTAMPPPMSAPTTISETPKPESKSLIVGLLNKLKKEKAPKADLTQSGPVEFHAEPVSQNYHAEAPQTTPLRAAVPTKAKAVDAEPAVKLKSGIPTWAAFLLGLMSGVILTFAGLALTAKSVENSLEARFSEVAKVVQSVETMAEEVAAESSEAPTPTRDDL